MALAGASPPRPDDLLAQIADLIQQYVSAGGDPAAVQQAVDAAAGTADQGQGQNMLGGMMGGQDMGPQDMGPPPPDQENPAEEAAPEEEPEPATGARTFKEANKSALPRLKNRNKKAKGK